MIHASLDRYSRLDSLIHRLDPRTRILTALVFVLAVAITPPSGWRGYILYAILVASLIWLARLPLLYALKRSAVVVPFVLAVTIFAPFLGQGKVIAKYSIWRWQVSLTYDGLTVLWTTLVKAWLSALGLLLVSATTPFPQLLRGLEKLGLPRVMIMTLSFTYRYIFVLSEEGMRMQRARESRSGLAPGLPGQHWLRQVKAVAGMIGTLFIRSYERGDRVYQAMLARGFDGEIRTLNELQFGPRDLRFASGFSLFLAVIVLLATR